MAPHNCRKSGKYRPTVYHNLHLYEEDEKQSNVPGFWLRNKIDGGTFTDTKSAGGGY